MKRFYAAFFFICAIAAIGVFFPVSAHASQPVKVQVNDELVGFPDQQPFIDDNGRTQVPARFVSEKLGYQVDWAFEGKQVKVDVSKGGKKITFITGQKFAVANGKKIALDTESLFVGGRALVPVRFVNDAMGVRTQWDNDNFVAILDADGNYHAPAWFKPKYKAEYAMTATAYSSQPSENKWGNLDFLGKPLALGTIAVDPKVIPLGSKLYIKGYDASGLPVEGLLGTASDVGGAIKGMRIDIYMPGAAWKADAFGMQNVKVHVLN